MPIKEAEAWLQHVGTDESPLHWATEVEGTFIGTARLHSADELDQRAQYAVGILDRKRLGIGLGEEVTRAVIRYGFQDVGLHRIGLRVLAYNVRATACYSRCGFVEQGRERESALVGDTWHDDVIMGVLAQDAS
ncbi:GNAT family N-acetyltransferase [Nocardioides sp. zg-DK7169]|uniref:GNAT family N-acetyltransferase n=1 Tax=Nocardioides sp. zg-DK7169 TaxID=2736600 RepID=UPI001554E012|nr:GNAT family protein [Nocardioides sp. zg-DK7169]NPC95424.1 GNAT family N-acetyltransferase [Nocardioides sp. zg-DK7169]